MVLLIRYGGRSRDLPFRVFLAILVPLEPLRLGVPLALRVHSSMECANALDGDDELEGDELLPDDAQHHAQLPFTAWPLRASLSPLY